MIDSHMKVLFFDVFGTIVDWRGSLIKIGEEISKKNKENYDWPYIIDKWRSCYIPYMNKVRTGQLPWTILDDLHMMSIKYVLEEMKINTIDSLQLNFLVRGWHKLQPWPDSVNALNKLKNKYIISSLSNGNISLLVNMAKHSNISWDIILSAENFKLYKPDLRVYNSACRLLGISSKQGVMVAAHKFDLEAADNCGLKTIYINRPFEYGTKRKILCLIQNLKLII